MQGARKLFVLTRFTTVVASLAGTLEVVAHEVCGVNGAVL